MCSFPRPLRLSPAGIAVRWRQRVCQLPANPHFPLTDKSAESRTVGADGAKVYIFCVPPRQFKSSSRTVHCRAPIFRKLRKLTRESRSGLTTPIETIRTGHARVLLHGQDARGTSSRAMPIPIRIVGTGPPMPEHVLDARGTAPPPRDTLPHIVYRQFQVMG